MYNSVPVVRTYEVEVMVVRLNLYDGKLVNPYGVPVQKPAVQRQPERTR